MKIIYICHAPLPARTAAAIQASTMCGAMHERGHDVELAGVTPPHRPSATSAAGRLPVHPGVQVTTHGMPPVRGGGHVYAMRCAIRARRRRADLVYTRHLPSAYASATLGLPVVFESHFPPPRAGLGGRMLRRLLGHRNLRLLVVPSGALARYYRYEFAMRGDPRLVTAANAARDLGSASEVPAGGRLAVGVVTNMHHGRGLDVVQALAERFAGTDFHVVGGEGEHLARWRERIARHPNVTFHGYVEPADVNAYYRLFTIALAPYCSRVAGEGGTGNNIRYMSPITLVEYLSAGKAVLCANLPVLRELVKHEYNALLCDPRAVDPWSDALRRLQHDRDLLCRLAGNARESYLGRHTPGQRARSILSAL